MKRRELLQWALRGTVVALLPLPLLAASEASATGTHVSVWLNGRAIGTASAMTLISRRGRQGKEGLAGTLVFGALDARSLLGRRGFYADRLPELDLHVTQNGRLCYQVRGVVLVNEGWGYSADDLTNEVAFTYVARTLVRLAPFMPQQGGASRFVEFTHPAPLPGYHHQVIL